MMEITHSGLDPILMDRSVFGWCWGGGVGDGVDPSAPHLDLFLRLIGFLPSRSQGWVS